MLALIAGKDSAMAEWRGIAARAMMMFFVVTARICALQTIFPATA